MLQEIYDFIKGFFEPLGEYLVASAVPAGSSYASDIDSLIALVAVFVGFCAGMLMIRTRSHWLVRSGRLVVTGSLALLLVRLF